MAPDAADNLLDKMKAEITKLPSFPKKHALIDEEPWSCLLYTSDAADEL